MGGKRRAYSNSDGKSRVYRFREKSRVYSYWWDKAIVAKSRVYSYRDGKEQEIQLLVGKAGIQLVMGRSDYKAVGVGREGYTAMGGWEEQGIQLLLEREG
jgi:hypothetical protein